MKKTNYLALPAAGLTMLTLSASAFAAGDGTPIVSAPGSWALVNFALMDVIVFEALMLAVGYFIKTGNEEDEKKLKKHGFLRALSVVVGVVAVVAFLLTENIALATALVDRWTILMALLLVGQTVLVFFSRKEYKKDEDEELPLDTQQGTGTAPQTEAAAQSATAAPQASAEQTEAEQTNA